MLRTSTVLLLALTFAATVARADPAEFTRLPNARTLATHETSGSVGVDVGGTFGQFVKQPGVGGRSDAPSGAWRFAVTHLLLDHLAIRVEHQVRQPEATRFEAGALVPELRWLFGPSALAGFAPSLFAGGRARFNARRGSSLCVGGGLDRTFGEWIVLANVALERAVTPGREDVGIRWEAGVSRHLGDAFAVVAEGWGTVEWPGDMPMIQTHNLGLSGRYRTGAFYVAVGAAVSLKDRPLETFFDATAQVSLGASI